MSRKKPFIFSDANVPFGAELEPAFTKNGKPVVVFWQRQGEVVKVADDKHVWCDGIFISFYELTGFMLDKLGRKPSTGYQPSRFWKFDGEKLDKRHDRVHIIREAQQKGELYD